MKKLYKSGWLMLGIVLILFLFTGCIHKESIEQMASGQTYGFWYGLLHGFIAPFDFIAMLFSDHFLMYAPNNNGAWYAFGFLLGSGGWGFFGSHGANYRRRSRRRDEY